MEQFRPKEYVMSVYDIDFDSIKRKGIKALFFDVDNTFKPFDTKEIPEEAVALMQRLKQMGFICCILSNGTKERVQQALAAFGLEKGVWRAGKPFRFQIKRLMNQLNVEPTESAMIGDQVFTDVWGANRAGVYSILVKPVDLGHDEKTVHARRGLERKVIRRLGITPVTLKREEKAGFGVMRVNGETKVFGVIGDPIGHTLSPVIHQILIDHSGINAAYVPFHIHPENLKDAMKGAFCMQIQGLNVTIPHKVAVMDSCVSLDASAQLVRAVNTMKWTEKGYVGYNTDIDGLSTLIRLHGIPMKGRKVLILGAGGVARSALTVCYLMGAREVAIYNRTREKAQALINAFTQTVRLRGGQVPVMRALSKEDLEKEEFPVVLQMTSAGMTPHTDTLPVEFEDPSVFYPHIRYAADAVFNPSDTRFVKTVRTFGGQAEGGLSMLFYQGLKSFEIWNDRSFSTSEVQAMHQTFLDRARRYLS